MVKVLQRPTRRFTAAEVLRMLETGILHDGEPLELLEGELIVMPPQGPTHSSLTVIVRQRLERAYGARFHLRDHSTIRAGRDSLPEPDVAVVRGAPEAFLKALPTARETVLVVEVSSSTRAADERKVHIYGKAGFPAYWIIEVEPRRLVVHHHLAAGGRYRTTQILGDGAQVRLPGTTKSLRVRDLLP